MSNIIDTYNSISGTSDFSNVSYVNEMQVKPSQSDYDNGNYDRFFVRKVTDKKIIETDGKSFRDCSDFLYQKVSLNWKLTGPQNSIYVNGKQQKVGVIDYNNKSVNDANNKMFGIKDKLSNLLQYYKIS